MELHETAIKASQIIDRSNYYVNRITKVLDNKLKSETVTPSAIKVRFNDCQEKGYTMTNLTEACSPKQARAMSKKIMR